MYNNDEYNNYLTDKSQIINLVEEIYKRAGNAAYDAGYAKGYDEGKKVYSEELSKCRKELVVSSMEVERVTLELSSSNKQIDRWRTEADRVIKRYPVPIGNLLYTLDRKRRKVVTYVCIGYRNCPITGEALIRVKRYLTPSFPKSIPARIVGTQWFLSESNAKAKSEEE